jgi:hypothetical protein
VSEPSFPTPGIEPGSNDGIELGQRERAAETATGLDRGAARLEIAPLRLVLLASFWAVVAGLFSFALGETRLVEAAAKHERFIAAGRTINWSTPATKEHAAVVTSARLHGVFGGLLGLLMGLVGGQARRSGRAALVAGLVGACAGTLMGIAAPYRVLPVYARYRQLYDADLVASLVLHAGLWAGIGAAGGLALGLGLGGESRTCRAALGGLLGALGGGLLFDILGGVVFPLEETGLPTSASARTRLLARLLVAVLAAAGAAWAACQTRGCATAGEFQQRSRKPPGGRIG